MEDTFIVWMKSCFFLLGSAEKIATKVAYHLVSWYFQVSEVLGDGGTWQWEGTTMRAEKTTQ